MRCPAGGLLVLLIKPGVVGTHPKVEEEDGDTALTTLETFLDLIRNMVPQNLIQACCYTQYKTQKVLVNVESDHLSTILDEEEQHVCTSGENVDGLNIVAGLVLRRMGQERENFLILVQVLNMVTKKMVKMIM
ncbi:excitatory amino acid transporter 3 [Austrofundulus limnaeus]|uniref:Excitatory amino acid transporter 3 n=1 Tax=Austrofundulus limnaeus TaxID=52670 RepID=A0A2I4D6R7_AUSLI|nr:PREDICTED: excitatory amino acid transporter 3-like [Austrofundulus limnaeus]